MTMETLKVRIGGCEAAIVINQALEMVRPIPPMKAKAPRKYAINIMREHLVQMLKLSRLFLEEKDREKHR